MEEAACPLAKAWLDPIRVHKKVHDMVPGPIISLRWNPQNMCEDLVYVD